MPHSTVKLVSAEGFEFIVDYRAACVSNTIRNMLSSQGGEAALPAGEAAAVKLAAAE
jgi:transcription elongation factor B subunit 1